MTDDPQYLGLIEPSDCFDYCDEQKSANLIRDASCCTHSKFYYTITGLWSANCSLTTATELVAKSDSWDESAGEYATFQSQVLPADVPEFFVKENGLNMTSWIFPENEFSDFYFYM